MPEPQRDSSGGPKTWGHLRQTNTEYDAELWAKLSTLYEGGFAIDAAFRAKVLPKHPNETPGFYDERCRSASYVNYFGQVVNYFSSKLFSHQLTVVAGEGASADAIYSDFAEDADGAGNTFQGIMAQAFIRAASEGKALIGVDMPVVLEPAMSLLESDQRGDGAPNIFLIDNAVMLDWRKLADGSFDFCVLHTRTNERTSFAGNRGHVTDTFKVWEMLGGLAHWSIYELVRKADQASTDPPDSLQVQLVEGPHPTSFTSIPILDFRMPAGLWIGNHVGPMVLEHYDRRTKLVASQNKSLMAIPVVFLGSEIGAPRRATPADVQQNPGRGQDPAAALKAKGYMRLGKDDDFRFIEPDGNAYEITATQLKELVDEIFRVAHQMASSPSATSQALARSGSSKAEDRNGAETVLEAYGALIGKLAATIYDVISATRGEEIDWNAHGMSGFSVPSDRATIAAELETVAAPVIQSITYRVLNSQRVAKLMLGDSITPEMEQTINDEIEVAIIAEGLTEPEPEVVEVVEGSSEEVVDE